jgi:tetratricopeptide (TPR) repeat protein
MKNLNKYLFLSLALTFSANTFFIQKASAKNDYNPSVILNDSFQYKYSLADNLRTLERYAKSIEKSASNVRWKYVPENLIMAALWNKDTYHDDELVAVADQWLELSKKSSVNIQDQELTSIFANILKQNFKEAEISYNKLNKAENPYMVDVAKTLIGENKKTKASLQGNTFIYDVRVINIDQAKKLVKNWPDSAMARFILASTLKSKEEQMAGNEGRELNFQDALEEINKAVELDPNNLLYALKKAELSYDVKNPDAIDGQLRQVYLDSLKDSYIAEDIATFLARNKQISKSIDYLTDAVKTDKNRFSLYRKLNSLYSYTGNYLPIIELYENAIKENPQKIELYEDLAELYQKNKSDNKAMVELFQKAVKANPENSELHIALGDAYFDEKNTDAAIGEYLESIKINQQNSDSYGKLIGIYWDQNNNEQVVKYASEAIKNNPEYSMGYLWLASVYLKQNKQAEAVKVIKDSININPKFFPSYNLLGMAYKGDKKYELALEQFKKALELNPNYLEALLNMGDTYMQKGDFAQAERTYNLALISDPYNESIYFSLGNLFTDNKDFKRAEEAFQKAILLNPASLDSRNNLGNVYLKQNKLDDAIDEFSKVLDINDKYATAYYNIACAFSLKNDPKDSLRFLQLAIEMDKSLKEIAKKDTDFENIKAESKFKELTK